MDHFENSLQHLLAELERIDLLISACVESVRKINADDSQFLGLYISESEVDSLLEEPKGTPRWFNESGRRKAVTERLEEIRKQIYRKKEKSLSLGIDLRLHRLQHLFGLSPLEVDTILVCLAVELDLRYERLYAYLQDDVTRRRPSVDLVLGLLAATPDEKYTARSCFYSCSPLFRHLLVAFVDDPGRPNPPLISKYLRVDGRITRFLLNNDSPDTRILNFSFIGDSDGGDVQNLGSPKVCERLVHFAKRSEGQGVIIYLTGPYGVGRLCTAESVCEKMGVRLLVVEAERLESEGDKSCEKAFRLALREAKLQQAAVYLKGFDTLLCQEKKDIFSGLIRSIGDRPMLTILAGETPWEPADTLRGAPFARVELPKPDFSRRVGLWSTAFGNSDGTDSERDFSVLASRFKFTGGQILDAAATAKNLSRQRKEEKILPEDLYNACHLHSNQKLSSLARKINPNYRWGDIVLPADRLEMMRDICNHVKYRDRVYGDWGFDRKLSLGKGLSVLFAGPSGTGKTMAAEIIAGELSLELYKIDLATVVSKYIGETEKNLSRIFLEAETSNAILFFDEADALFGRRSEVKDAHDRYANIETGYLLQRMEEYEGVVILATNFRKNMDDAFVRRLHFTVEFPFPVEADRQRIWEKILPDETPKEPGLQFDFMARRFELSGGNIRNIALSAAFFAADDSGSVNMAHLLRATKREYRKMGKVIAKGDFCDPAEIPAIAAKNPGEEKRSGTG